MSHVYVSRQGSLLHLLLFILIASQSFGQPRMSQQLKFWFESRGPTLHTYSHSIPTILNVSILIGIPIRHQQNPWEVCRPLLISQSPFTLIQGPNQCELVYEHFNPHIYCFTILKCSSAARRNIISCSDTVWSMSGIEWRLMSAYSLLSIK